jgi:hypothetical protein
MPPTAPKRIQSPGEGLLAQCDASARKLTSRNVDRQLSQKIVGIHSRGIDTAQIAPAMFAVPVPNMRRAMRIIISTVSEENVICINKIATSEPNEKLPKNRKITATIVGYPGASRAVGPVDLPYGELNPRPACRLSAIIPSSIPLLKSQLCGNLVTTSHKIPRRSEIATATMLHK